MEKVFKNILESSQLPRIVELEKNHYAIVFSLMKLLPANYIITRAMEEGLIDRKTVIIESSSGTFGKGLAMVCNLRKLKLVIVSDRAIDESFKKQLEDLHAEVEIVEPIFGKGIQFARLAKLEELRAKISNCYWPCQYHNTWNRDSYLPVGKMLLEAFDKIDFLVGAVGSGGSMTGISNALRHGNPLLKAIAVDTHGSVLFGQPDSTRILRGLGNSLIPKNLNHSVFNEVHWVTAQEAFLSTRKLHQEKSIFAGPTAGASFMVGEYLSITNPEKIVLSIFADEGWRYPEIFDNNWLIDKNLFQKTLPDQPRFVSEIPLIPGNEWTYINWNNRSLKNASLITIN